MAYNTIVQTGSFTSDGAGEFLNLRQGIDWINVYNFTQMAAQNDVAVQFYWQRGMGTSSLSYFKDGGGDNLNALVLASSFLEFDTSANPVGANVATTASSNVVQPIISTGATAGLQTGSVVRLNSMANVPNIMGIDFEIDTVVLNTSFRIAYVLANAPGAVGGAGFYRIINFDSIYYPRRRFICNITQAASAVVTMTVTHGYTVGQQVRFQVPAAFGMIEMNGLTGNITAINTTTNTITVDINSSAFTAFLFPAPGAVPFTQAQVVPLGEDTGVALSNNADILDDATFNTALTGILLQGGAGFPAGDTADVIYWQAGKSFSNNN